MVLVMDSDGSLTPSRSQSGFARNYNDGIGQSSASDGIAIFGEVEAEQEGVQVAALARPTPLPRADVLSGIQTTALRYAGHPGLRRAGLSVTDWLALYRANIEVESAYRQDAISSAGAIGLGQLMPATARDLGVDPRDPLQNLDGSARYLAMMLETFGDGGDVVVGHLGYSLLRWGSPSTGATGPVASANAEGPRPAVEAVFVLAEA